jgi:hypothetical protein
LYKNKTFKKPMSILKHYDEVFSKTSNVYDSYYKGGFDWKINTSLDISRHKGHYNNNYHFAPMSGTYTELGDNKFHPFSHHGNKDEERKSKGHGTDKRYNNPSPVAKATKAVTRAVDPDNNVVGDLISFD